MSIWHPFNEYEESPRVLYGDMMFIRVCPECGRFVKADKILEYRNYEFQDRVEFNVPNATCAKHGRVNMPFEGYYP